MAVSRADTVVTTGATASLLITFHGFSPPLVPVSFVEAPSRSSAGFLACTRLQQHKPFVMIRLQPGASRGKLPSSNAGIKQILHWLLFYLQVPFRTGNGKEQEGNGIEDGSKGDRLRCCVGCGGFEMDRNARFQTRRLDRGGKSETRPGSGRPAELSAKPACAQPVDQIDAASRRSGR